MNNKSKNIVLIGMPASGKSTVGVILAKVLGMDFLDTDIVIQQREGARLNEIIEKEGVDGFLKKEEEALLSINVSNTVIATGGSAVYSETAMRQLGSQADRVGGWGWGVMELIQSFSVDHTLIVPGIFTSRVDYLGEYFVTTYDIRLKRPNREPVIDVLAMHSLEHIIATYLRNDPDWKDEVILW